MTIDDRKVFGRQRWDNQVAQEIREFHREIWAATKVEWGMRAGDSIEWIPGIAESLQSLLDQDYTANDISIFMGLSRERVRQLIHKLGLQVRTRSVTTARIFDWDLGRFVSVNIREMRRLGSQARGDARREREQQAREEKWAAVEQALFDFAVEYKRAPSVIELARKVMRIRFSI